MTATSFWGTRPRAAVVAAFGCNRQRYRDFTLPSTPDQWYGVTVTNNIIVNNVAGWDGGGVALQMLEGERHQHTVASNDTTASAGVLFNAIGAPLTSAGAPNCVPSAGNAVCTSPQPADWRLRDTPRP